MKRKIKFTIGLLVCLLSVAVMSCSHRSPYAGAKRTATGTVIDTTLISAAAAMNKGCPSMVDAQCRLDSLSALPDNTFQFNYTMVQYTREPEHVEEFRELLTTKMLNALKASTNMNFFKDRGTTVAYCFYDRNSDFLFAIYFSPEDYRN